MKTAILILGNQLLKDHPALKEYSDAPIIMIEADDLCRKLNYHKHKLIFVLASMREYRDVLSDSGRQVMYREHSPDSKFKDVLKDIISDNDITQLAWMQTSDRSPTENLMELCDDLEIKSKVLDNKQFLLTHDEFNEWFSSQKSPLMENFYRWHRKRTGYLMEGSSPVGDAWNFDKDNRKPLPKKGLSIPAIPKVDASGHVDAVTRIVDEHFQDNPGSSSQFWLPTTHKVAHAWLNDFIENRLEKFGPYEDAMKEGETFLFHSVLSPLINLGLLSPRDVVEAVLAAYEERSLPLNSVEGFVRQVVGWREYMHGLYWQKPEMKDANFFGFEKRLEDWWYTQDWQKQELPVPVQHALATTHEYGYNHHIERLMVLGNWFLLNEYDPMSVYEWFNSMYVDAYEWVMVPNVQGMSQYADGGFVATKPYISGGNYLQKMGNFWSSSQEAKESEFTTLYWQFLNTHRDKLKDNPRMSLVLKLAEKQS